MQVSGSGDQVNARVQEPDGMPWGGSIPACRPGPHIPISGRYRALISTVVRSVESTNCKLQLKGQRFYPKRASSYHKVWQPQGKASSFCGEPAGLGHKVDCER